MDTEEDSKNLLHQKFVKPFIRIFEKCEVVPTFSIYFFTSLLGTMYLRYILYSTIFQVRQEEIDHSNGIYFSQKFLSRSLMQNEYVYTKIFEVMGIIMKTYKI